MIDFKSEQQFKAELDKVWEMLYLERSYAKQLQARVDELMFEYCPDEMTEEQLENYCKSVGVVDE